MTDLSPKPCETARELRGQPYWAARTLARNCSSDRFQFALSTDVDAGERYGWDVQIAAGLIRTLALRLAWIFADRWRLASPAPANN